MKNDRDHATDAEHPAILHDKPAFPEACADAELTRDIGFALAKSPLRPKHHTAIDACLTAASQVVVHIGLCGWLFTRKPPLACHGTPGPVREPVRSPAIDPEPPPRADAHSLSRAKE